MLVIGSPSLLPVAGITRGGAGGEHATSDFGRTSGLTRGVWRLRWLVDATSGITGGMSYGRSGRSPNGTDPLTPLSQNSAVRSRPALAHQSRIALS
jgi:hypothetical protein